MVNQSSCPGDLSYLGEMGGGSGCWRGSANAGAGMRRALAKVGEILRVGRLVNHSSCPGDMSYLGEMGGARVSGHGGRRPRAAL